MRDIFLLFVHRIVTVIRLLRPGGLRAVVAESTLVRHQLVVPENPVAPEIIEFSCAAGVGFCGHV